MFIFPHYRHEKAPITYRLNIGLIVIALFNLMAYPAYAEIKRMVVQQQYNQRLINEVDAGQDMADVLAEIQTLLTALQSPASENFALLTQSDPVLKQGEEKQRQRLHNLIAILPEKYHAMQDALTAEKDYLQQQNNPALKTVLSEIDTQLADMQRNYQQLMTIAQPAAQRRASGEKQQADAELLALLQTFDTAPQQQTDTGPSNITLNADSIIHQTVRTTIEEFAEEQAISRAQLAAAKSAEPVASAAPTERSHVITAKKSPPNFQSPIPDAALARGKSDEIKLTPRIKAKAEELDYDPVKIYYWVRNNIEFVPTWGAYQTAEHTLGARQGNAVDTASLLIALLRASNIPARYAHGTIRVTPDKFKNWIGDFADAKAATDYASRQGLRAASVYLRPSNTLIGINVEHMWVEAAIDYHPSRGMKNKVADTWLPMDASFKQYEYLDGLDVETIGGIDAEQLVKDFEASGTVNETEGWTQGFDASIIEKAQKDAQKKLETHIKTLTDPTVGDVLGGNKVIIREYPVLGAGLSNEIIVRGAHYVKVPRNYQAQIGLAMRPVTRTGIINIPQPPIDDELTYYPLSQFNSEKTILRFTPATPADKAALEALVPQNATNMDDLPQFIGSGIKVIPELLVNGKVLLTGSPMAIAKEVQLGYKPRLPNINQQRPAMTYDIIAGSYLHIPIVGYSVNPYQLLDTKKRVEATQKILESKDQNQLKTLTREQILGDIFYTGGLGYFAQLHTMNRMASHYGNGIGRIVAGYGSYGYEPKLKQAGPLANPVGILPGSIATNMRVHQSTWRKDSSKADNNIDFTIGMNSSILESAISEQLFCNDKVNPNNEPCYGISTVSGLQRAAQQGQKIYQIDSKNRDQLKNIAMSDENMANDINKAINSDGYVIVPEKAVDGTGRNAIYVYMTYDGQTGAQSWKISGGLNGGWLSGLVIGFGFGVFLIATVLLAVGLIAASFLFVGLLMALLVTALIAYFYVLEQVVEDEELRECFGQGILLGMDIASAAYLHFGATGRNLISALLIGEMYFTRNSPSCEFY